MLSSLDGLSKPKFVLVGGKRCAGKDTIAARLRYYVENRFNDDRSVVVVWTSFAEAVKREAADKHQLDFDRLKNDPAYEREHHQMLTDLDKQRRQEDKNYWVDKVFAAHGGARIVIIIDWRFYAEKDRLRDFGARVICVHVRADEETRRRRGWIPNPVIDNDETETALDNCAEDPAAERGCCLTFVDNDVDDDWEALDQEIYAICEAYIWP